MSEARLSLLSKRDLLTIALAYLSPDWGSLMAKGSNSGSKKPPSVEAALFSANTEAGRVGLSLPLNL